MHSNYPNLLINRGMEPSEVVRLVENASWFTSCVLSALLELSVVLLLLVGAIISYLTFIIVRFFDLHPPCFYPGAGLMEETINFCGSQCAACSHCIADTNNNLCLVSSNSKYHLAEKHTTHCKNRRAHLRSHESTMSIDEKNSLRLKGGTRCMYCSSPFQQLSGYRVKKRKFVTLIPGQRILNKFRSRLPIVPDEELTSYVAFPVIKLERESGSFFFSEDIPVHESEGGENTLEKPFDKMLCEKSLSVGEEIIHKKGDDFQLEDSVQSSLSEDIFHIKDENEYLSNQLRCVPEDFVLNSKREVLISGNLQCNSPRGHQTKLLTFGSLDEKIKDSLQCGTKEIEMEVLDVKSDKGDIDNEVDLLRMMLNTERETLSALYLELEQERSASAIAANETMAMIARLQKEKAALQMEAIQFQRIAEEKAMYDREAIAVLKDILMKREAEKLTLEKEVELYRWRLLKDRIEDLERMTKDRGSNSKVAISGDDAESILLLEERTKSKSFRIEDCDGDSSFTTIKASENTDEQLCSSENISNSYLIAHSNDDLQLNDHENQCQSNMLSLSTSYSSVTEIDEDKIHISGDKYMVIPKDVPCEGIQRRLCDEWAGCSDSCRMLPISDGSFPVKDGDGIEDSVVGKPRCNSREKWQTVLKRLHNLESQVQYLQGKQNAERPDLPIVDRGGILYKDLGIQEAYNANPSWETLEHRCSQEDLCFEHNDWFPLEQNGWTNFNTQSYTKRLHDLECNDTLDLSKVQSRKQCIQNITDTRERSCSLSAYACTLDPNTNEQNIRQCDSYTLNNNTFIKGSEDFDFKTETPQKPSGLVSVEDVSFMLEESALTGNVGTPDQIVNHESLELLDKRYSNISRNLDFRTLSMIIRDNSRIAIDQEVQELTSRLQALDGDREFMRQRIESMKQERTKVEMVQEVTQQFESQYR